MKQYRTTSFSEESIQEVIQRIDRAANIGEEPGIAVVLDDRRKVIGVVTDGDIRRAYVRSVDFSRAVGEIMSKNPVRVLRSFDAKTMLREATKQMKAKGITVDKIVTVDESGCLIDVVALHKLYLDWKSHKRVAVYGMGFVGLPLALALAEHDTYEVTGVDVAPTVVENLKNGVPSFFEKGIDSVLQKALAERAVKFMQLDTREPADIHIICVGTLVDRQRCLDTSQLESAGRSIGKVLKDGDLVICRSTVSVGTTRNVLIPILEQESGLKAGKNFFVAFTPERTIEGDALRELRSLPQIVGGLTEGCREQAALVFQKLTNTIVRVESLEAAEIIKLINNAFRDLVFSFANEVAFLCDAYNQDAYRVISAANEGYPRNPIPSPSPGVGGACLTKDPYLYTIHNAPNMYSPIRLGVLSREINESAPKYVHWLFKKYLQRNGSAIGPRRLKVFLVGFAFKGVPDTSDMRHSPAIEVLDLLKQEDVQVYGYDAVVRPEALRDVGVIPCDLITGFQDGDAVFIMNNHPRNVEFQLYSALKTMRRPALFFDGWSLFNKHEIESTEGIYYATMGYLTPNA